MKPDNPFVHPQHRVWNAAMAEYEDTTQHPGITLRDHFAGQALAPMVAEAFKLRPFGNDITQHLRQATRNAYAVADMMLAAREATSGKSLETKE